MCGCYNSDSRNMQMEFEKASDSLRVSEQVIQSETQLLTEAKTPETKAILLRHIDSLKADNLRMNTKVNNLKTMLSK
jgi:hypothetical protein